MYTLGVDLGGTNIVVGLLDDKYEIIDKKSVLTQRERNYKEILKDIATLCIEIIKDNDVEESNVKWIGVGSPGTCDSKNCVVTYSNNLGFRDVNIKEEIQKYINLPIFLGNDANCAAYGEYKAGAGRGTTNASMITLGTGIGGGFIVDGKLLEGNFFNGAEMGHTVISVDGRQCSCGRRGCFEAYCSATALIDMANEVAENNETMLHKLNDSDKTKTTAKIVFDCFDAGDELMKQVVEKYYTYLAEGISNVINIFDPEILIIGGGVSARGQMLIEPVLQKIKDRAYGKGLNCEIKIAELGNDAGIIGAALLGLNV